MTMSILDDNSIELLDKLKEIKNQYEEKKKAFKEFYVKHKEELGELEQQAKEVYEEWKSTLSEGED